MNNRITENRLIDEKIEKYRFSNRYDAPSVEDVQDMAQEVYERRQAEKEPTAFANLQANTVKLPLESLPKTEKFWSVMYDLIYQVNRKSYDNWNVSLAFSEAKEFVTWLNEVMPFRDAGGERNDN